MIRIYKSSINLTLALFSAFLIGCGGGGGGGGDDYIGAAEVFVDAQPTTLDPGNLVRVFVEISHPNSRGILLKIRFPRALHYVSNTTLLNVEGEDDPTFINPRDYKATTDTRYLVYSIPYTTFNGAEHARLRFDLEALSEASEKFIQVDADVDSKKEFDVANPAFDAQDEVGIEIVD